MKKFEDYLAQVEKVAQQLEEGNLGIEESLAKYEVGIKALRKCYEILETMQKKVEVLVKEKNGSIRVQPLEEKEKR